MQFHRAEDMLMRFLHDHRHGQSEGAVDTRTSPDIEAIAERIVYREKWRLCEEGTVEQVTDTSSLKWVRLFPEHPAIQVAAIGGWVETRTGQRSLVADCDTFRAAGLALAREARCWRMTSTAADPVSGGVPPSPRRWSMTARP
jgi:hypothetical protein